MNIKTDPISELKAAVYDRLILIERTQKEIKFLNEEIEHRHKKLMETKGNQEATKKKDK